MTKILPLLTPRYSILCTRRLQPPRDDCAVRVQWFSSVVLRPFSALCLKYYYQTILYGCLKVPSSAGWLFITMEIFIVQDIALPA